VNKNQSAKILSALQTGRSITALEALHEFGCLRLAARIKDLRRSGHPIRSKMVHTNEGKRIAVYELDTPTDDKGQRLWAL